MTKRRTRTLKAIAVAGASTLLLLPSCSSDPKSPGALMIALTSDLELPHDVTALGVSIESRGVIVHSQVYETLDESKGGSVLQQPGTLALLAPTEGDGPTVRIRAVAYMARGPAILRQSLVKVPTDRLSLLSMPLLWVNQFPASVMQPESNVRLSPQSVVDGCGADETRSGGVCVSANVDFETLPKCEQPTCGDQFIARRPDNFKEGKCYETPDCFEKCADSILEPGSAFQREGATCRFRYGGTKTDATQLNFAIRTTEAIGQCKTRTNAGVGSNCYIAVPKQLTARDDGWTLDGSLSGGLITLPPWACEKATAPHVLLASLGCDNIAGDILPCGPANQSAIGTILYTGMCAAPPADAGTDASIEASTDASGDAATD